MHRPDLPLLCGTEVQPGNFFFYFSKCKLTICAIEGWHLSDLSTLNFSFASSVAIKHVALAGFSANVHSAHAANGLNRWCKTCTRAFRFLAHYFLLRGFTQRGAKRGKVGRLHKRQGWKVAPPTQRQGGDPFHMLMLSVIVHFHRLLIHTSLVQNLPTKPGTSSVPALKGFFCSPRDPLYTPSDPSCDLITPHSHLLRGTGVCAL